MIRTDKAGLPMLVQEWDYTYAQLIEVKLFTGDLIHLDLCDVREHSCRRYTRWDVTSDGMAVDAYIEAHKRFYLH